MCWANATFELTWLLPKQRAALQRTEEPEALFTKPTAIIIDSDLKTTPSSADNTATIKLLILKEPTELQESEGKRKGGILSCSIVGRAIKKQMRPYGRYLCVTVEAPTGPCLHGFLHRHIPVQFRGVPTCALHGGRSPERGGLSMGLH